MSVLSDLTGEHERVYWRCDGCGALSETQHWERLDSALSLMPPPSDWTMRLDGRNKRLACADCMPPNASLSRGGEADFGLKR